MSIRIAAIIATALLGLTLAGCSSEDTSTPAVAIGSIGSTSPTSSPTPTSTVRCADFPVSNFIGKPASRAHEVEPLGWYPSYVNADPSAVNASVDSALATIEMVEKKKFGCQAIFTVRVTTPKPVEPPKPAGLTEGTYLVGTDMEPGSYKTPGGSNCYWARLKDDAGQDIIANNSSSGPMRFTVKKGEYLEIRGSCVFTKA